jgi:hypothetical protein
MYLMAIFLGFMALVLSFLGVPQIVVSTMFVIATMFGCTGEICDAIRERR